jgi:hypothetical protein
VRRLWEKEDAKGREEDGGGKEIRSGRMTYGVESLVCIFFHLACGLPGLPSILDPKSIP